MTGLEVILAVAALAIGLTGAWSPCGFSMVETIGPTGHSGGRPATLAALATFIPGALVGGVLTFGALAWLGDVVHGAGGRFAYAFAAAIAVAAALAEARGVPIVPQIRRQLPEHWRRVMPMPVAAGLYGVLLGLGFTTFVLSFGVWALAGIAFAIGDPAAGVVIGLAFGAGRALPVLALAPVCDRPSGLRVTAAMTERPSLYRGARRGDAVALMATAVALMVAPAGAATTVVKGAADPSASGTDIVFEKVGGAGVLRRAGGGAVGLPGTDPAIGGPWVAVRQKSEIVLLSRDDLAEAGRIPAAGADAVAVSPHWIAWRAATAGGDLIRARSFAAGDTGIVWRPGGVVARAAAPATLGRPSLDGAKLVYSHSSTRANSLRLRVLTSGRGKTLLASRHWLLSAPSVFNGSFSFVRTTNERQEVRLRKLGGRKTGHLLYSIPATSYRDRDHGIGHHRLPTRVPPPDRSRTNTAITGTTLTRHSIYLTQLIQKAGHVSAKISRTPR